MSSTSTVQMKMNNMTLKPNDYRIIKKTIPYFILLLISYHYAKNIHLLSSSMSSSNSSYSYSSISPMSSLPYTTTTTTTTPKNTNLRIHHQYSKAYDQSLGFFTDIPTHDWDTYLLRIQNHDRYMDGDIKNNRIYLDSDSHHVVHKNNVENDNNNSNDSSSSSSNDNNNGNDSSSSSSSSSSSTAHLFYQNNYDAEFTCPHEIQIGAVSNNNGRVINETPKWICDPHRILPMSQRRQKEYQKQYTYQKQKQKNDHSYGHGHGHDNHKHDDNHEHDHGCLIYIFTQENSKELIMDLNTLLNQQCQIHIFSKVIHNQLLLLNRDIQYYGKNVHIHPFGLEGGIHIKDGRRDYMTFSEIVNTLNHNKHVIDVLSIDCEGCEWDDVYREVLDTDVTVIQMLIELHRAPYKVNDFFLEMRRNNYVIFHKESNTVDDNQGGQNQEYSFLKLAPEFFE